MIDEIINPSYLVGGCVRDALLGLEPKDYDFATPLLPDDIEQRVRDAGIKPGLLGKRFGTIDFKYKEHHLEVTTFRKEVYIGESRKPEVQFVSSINEDLARRDFTINAIAKRGTKLIDPFGGQADLKVKLIRAVGNPSERFNEDPLRMLRAARFSAQLGFEIDETTHKAIVKNAHKILSVSKERWMQELDRLLTSEFAGKGIWVLYETDLMKFMLPELRLQYRYNQNSDWHDLALHEHSIATMLDVPKDINLRWAALLHDIGKPFVRTDNKRGSSNYVFHELVGSELVYGIGKRLKWSNERLKAVQELVKTHLQDDSPIREADNKSKKLATPTPADLFPKDTGGDLVAGSNTMGAYTAQIEAEYGLRPESLFNSGKSKSGNPTYDGNLKSLTESTVGERLHDAGRLGICRGCRTYRGIHTDS